MCTYTGICLCVFRTVRMQYKSITLFFLFYLLQEVCVECSALVENTTATTTTNIPHKRNITESYTATTATSNKNSNKKNSTECEVSDVDYSDSEEDAEIFHRYRAERSRAAATISTDGAITVIASDNQSAQHKPMYTATVAPTTSIATVTTSGDGVDVALQVLQQVSLLYILLTLYNTIKLYISYYNTIIFMYRYYIVCYM